MPKRKLEANPCVLLPEVWKSYVLLLTHALGIVTARLEAECQQKGFSARMGWILMAAEYGPHSQTFIAQCLCINNNVMVKMVDALESKQLIRRKRNPDNRRESLLVVTPKGRAILKWIHDDFEQRTARIFFPVPLDELRSQMVPRFRAIIDEHYRKSLRPE
jgi:DNA-binding MarR family transcriptional regulator